MPPVIVENAATDCLIGRFLIFLGDRRVYIQAAGIGFVLVLVIHHHPDHFSDVFGMNVEFVSARFDLDRFVFGLFVLLVSDVTQLFHAKQDILLPLFGSGRVGDGVICRRRFWQTGEHGGFCQSDVFKWLAEINLCCCCKAESALSEINLVEINFENLVLGQGLFDFPGKKDFINLAFEGLFAGQKEIAGNLLCNR